MAVLRSTSTNITYHRATVDGVGIFYREAGPKDAPMIVLLHGFPSSSRMFDSLVPLLAVRYRLIAPDYPGFGQSDAPPPDRYAYSFDHLAETTNALLEQLGVDRYSLYLQDYGGPVGFRIMLAHPDRAQGLVIQNANAYALGLGAKWAGIAEYWADPKAHPEIPVAFTSLAAAEVRHDGGSPVLSATIRRFGRRSTRSYHRKDSRRSRKPCSTTIASTSPPIRRGRRGCAGVSRRRLWSGAAMTAPSSRPGPKLSGPTFPTQKSTSSTLATSRSTRRSTRSPR